MNSVKNAFAIHLGATSSILAMRLLLSFALATLLLPTPSAFGQAGSGKSAIEQPSFRSGLSAPVRYFIGADGVRLAYRKLGRGKHVVVCVHGGPGLNMASGCADAEPLAKRATLIMYDQRGSGRSELVTDPRLLTATSHVRDLEALRKHFRISRMTLIGFSWGAGLVGLYAIAHPERVERLLLVAPLPPAKTPYWEQRLAKIREKLGSEVAARMSEIRRRIPEADDAETLALCRALRVGYRAYLYNPSNLSRVRDRCDASPASIRNGIMVARATLDSLGDWDFRPQLAKLKMPVLVIEGAQTEVPLEATRYWVASIPNARLFLVPNAGHELWAEQPTIFIMAVEQFLSGKYPKGSQRVVNLMTTSSEEEKDSQRAEKLALGPCEDTNVNFFLPVMEAQALLPVGPLAIYSFGSAG